MSPETQTDKTAKMLERVRALLAKADGTNYPAEADSFRAKADALMTAYAIEQWQVDQAQSGVNATTMPEKRSFDFSWWYDSNWRDDLWSLFNAVAHHCRCVIATRGHRYKDMPIIGLPSDMDYFDMLFTHLMLQMGKQLEPKPDPALSLAENAYRLRISGLNRYRVAELMYNCRANPTMGPPAFPELRKGNELYPAYSDLPPNRNKSLRAKLRVTADKYAAEHGLTGTTAVHPVTWQRSFTQGFVQEIRHRLYAMRKVQEGEPTSGPSVAMVVQDIYDKVVVLYDEMYPKPKPPECKESGCTKRPVYDGYCEDHCKAHGIKIPKARTSVARVKEVTFSELAYGAGSTAGKQASLNANPNTGVGGGRGALPSGS